MGEKKDDLCNGLSLQRLERLSSRMSEYIDQGKLAGMVVAIGRNGESVYRKRWGYQDRETQKPMEFDSLFRIMSMTKIVTSVALMTLYEEGRFNLNTPVTEFIPEFRNLRVYPDSPLERPVTFSHLFTHTAGLCYGYLPDDPVDQLYHQKKSELGIEDSTMTLEDLIRILSETPLVFQPGSRFRYSYAIDVLGYIATVITGQPLDQVLAERIFEPLGMSDTGFSVPPDKSHRLTSVYGHPNNPKELVRIESGDDSSCLKPPSFLRGGGGLISTIDDYSRFLQMLVNGGVFEKHRILSPSTVALFEMNHVPDSVLPFRVADGEDPFNKGYGLSLGTRVLLDPAASGKAGSVGEFGWDGYYCTHCWVDRSLGLYGILMTQHEPFNYYPLADQFKQLTYQALLR